MRCIIAGSRSITDPSDVDDAIRSSGWFEKIETVLSGTARGVDRMGERWAENHVRHVERWPADWNRHGKSAGFLRNQDMAANADALIAVWDGKSRGTSHMVGVAYQAGLYVYVHTV